MCKGRFERTCLFDRCNRSCYLLNYFPTYFCLCLDRKDSRQTDNEVEKQATADAGLVCTTIDTQILPLPYLTYSILSDIQTMSIVLVHVFCLRQEGLCLVSNCRTVGSQDKEDVWQRVDEMFRR
jgi:hypothetical protein